MTSIPVSFDYKNKHYSGFLVQITGNATKGGHAYHLYINNYYRGSLRLAAQSQGGVPIDPANVQYDWRFTSQTGEFEELTDYFVDVLIAWYC